jgi:hypothetical protein
MLSFFKRKRGQNIKMDPDKLPFNWFDMLIGVTILIGLQRGRARGMTQEIFSVLTWVTIAIVGAFGYEPLGNMLIQSNVADPLGAYIMAYVGIAIVLFIVFSMVKRSMEPKLAGSDAFGRGEFYLGMMSGVVRFCCILVFGLSILNARQYAPAEIRADLSYQTEVYGSDFFPKLYTIQGQVFEQSAAGPWIKKNLASLMIRPTPNKTTQKPTAPAGAKQKEMAMP